MQTFIDTTSQPKAAFMRGFWKGMAAPLMLFSAFDLPAEARPMPFQPLARRSAPPASEWLRVGQALRLAAAKDRAAGGG